MLETAKNEERRCQSLMANQSSAIFSARLKISSQETSDEIEAIDLKVEE